MNSTVPSENTFRLRIESGLLALLFVLMFEPVFASLVYAWNTRPDASHGWFVVPIAAWIAWKSRKDLLAAPKSIFTPALGIIILGLLMAIVAERIALESVGRLSLVMTLNGLLLYTLGWPRYRAVAFPALFLFLMVPVPVTFTGAITFPLQLLASQLSEVAISLIGIPVERMGNVLSLPGGKLEVAEACSGLRSLMTFVTLGVLLAWLAPVRWKQLAIGLLAVPFALFANVLRITLTAAAVQLFGQAGAEGILHEGVGIVSFIVSLALYAALARVLGSRWASI